jgi:uncharacterized membrane protein YcaP (DUF421 family)
MEFSDFFQSWSNLGRVIVVGVAAYVGVVFMLRITGKRTLSQMNVFDFIVTVALGSVLATLLLSKDTALAEGLTAFAVLIFLQFVITWTTSRSQWVLKVIKAEPTLLVADGRMLKGAMRRERVAAKEILAAVREAGEGDLAEVRAVVLETDGTFSVIPMSGRTPAVPTLAPVGNRGMRAGSQ